MNNNQPQWLGRGGKKKPHELDELRAVVNQNEPQGLGEGEGGAKTTTTGIEMRFPPQHQPEKREKGRGEKKKTARPGHSVGP